MSYPYNALAVLGGFGVTLSQTTIAKDTVTVTSGIYDDRNVLSDASYVYVAGAAVSTAAITLAATGYKRIDLVVYETSTANTKGFKVVTGTAVLAAATAVAPQPTNTQVAIAQIPVTAAAIGSPIDARCFPSYIAVRAFNRSQAVRIGGQKVLTGASSYIDTDDPKVRKELAYHSSIGAVYTTGPVSNSGNGVSVRNNTGLKVTLTYSSPNFTAAVAAGEIFNRETSTITTVTGANATTTGLVAGTGNLRADIVWVDNYDASVGVTAGTAAATGTQVVPFSSVPANKTPIAVIIYPAAASAASDATVIDIRPLNS